ncbi:hypothetical protein ACSBR1_016583 [Camellia fascicularis]
MKLLIAVLIFFLFSAAADSCSDFMFPDNKVFTSCTNLSALNSFLYWSQNPSSTTLDMAYRHSHVPPSTWVAWGINPKPNKMVGTQAIIAYQKPDGNMAVYTSSVDSYATQLQKGNLSFPVSDLSALFSNDEIIIFATIQLPNSSSTINHVWQDGPITGNHLGIHDLSGHHLQSMGTLNLLSGQVFASHGSDSKTKLKISHGVLNTISWGIMMPIGLLVARYLKAVGPAADPLWFYLHIVVQLSAYIIGLAGGATGFLLLSKSSGIHHPCHLGIGIILFSLGLLQVSALLLRPSKDHKYRYLWNLFHHNTGYAVILLSFFNIWLGFSILKPAKKWMIAYGVVLGALILSAFLLEVWKKFARDGRTGGAHEEVNKSASTSSGLYFIVITSVVMPSDFLQKIAILNGSVSIECAFCSQEIESVNHVLLFCPFVWKVWTEMLNWWLQCGQFGSKGMRWCSMLLIQTGLSSDLLTMHKSNVAKFLSKNYDWSITQSCWNLPITLPGNKLSSTFDSIPIWSAFDALGVTKSFISPVHKTLVGSISKITPSFHTWVRNKKLFSDQEVIRKFLDLPEVRNCHYPFLATRNIFKQSITHCLDQMDTQLNAFNGRLDQQTTMLAEILFLLQMQQQPLPFS